MRSFHLTLILTLITSSVFGLEIAEDSKLTRVKHNNPGLITDLGIGLWASPFPMDFDNDGDMDLLAATADIPYKGLYFFENDGTNKTFPVFKPAQRIASAEHNITVSYIDGKPHMLTHGKRYPDFFNTYFDKPVAIPYEPTFKSTRARQWKFCDFDGDGINDLIFGSSDWTEYGWDNAYNAKGEWTNGPIHGHIYIMKNTGTNEKPVYSPAHQLQAGGQALDVYGCPSPNFFDFDQDGDLDLITGSFLDTITYFENTGTRTKPVYARGKYLTHKGGGITHVGNKYLLYLGETLHMELQMLQVVVFDWNQDGKPDIFVGEEDGRVAMMLNNGNFKDGVPQFLPPFFLKQEADNLKVGALTTPYSIDWDNDGDEDLIAGDTAGFVSFVENLDGGTPPKWAKPIRLKADGETLRIQAGPNGSIQGPAEAKWGYTTLSVADWDHDSLNDIMINSIWGKVLWYKNVGTKEEAKLAAAQPVQVAWDGTPQFPAWNWWKPKGNNLATQWRTTPVMFDLNKDGLNDLVMLDHEGYLAYFQRKKEGDTLSLTQPQRIFKDEAGNPLRLNDREAGRSGRRKWCFTDWNGDGKLDIIINSKPNVDFLENIAEKEGEFQFKNAVPMDPHLLAGHTTSPAVVDWNKNGIPDLVIGAEDGFFYYLENPRK
jgi:hypothetical protein